MSENHHVSPELTFIGMSECLHTATECGRRATPSQLAPCAWLGMGALMGCGCGRPRNEVGTATLSTLLAGLAVQTLALLTRFWGATWGGTGRTAPPDQVLASQLLGEQLLPLYLYYIDDHIRRLGSIGENSLAIAFREWHDQLTR